MTQRSRRKTPEQDAIDHIILGRDKPFLEARFINTFKGKLSHTEVCGGAREAGTEHRTTANTSGDKMCHHVLTSAVISSLDNYHDCTGPVSSLKWIGFTCKLCSTSWHKTCFIKNNESPMKDICLSSNEGSVSDKDYIPETASSSDGSSADEDCPPDSEANTDWDHLIATIRDSKPPHCKTAPTVSTKNCVEQQDTDATTSDKFQLHEHFIPDMASSSDNEPTTSNPQNLTTAVTESHYSERILNLKNNELDQLANFLGHDIRVHRDFYRLPEATIEIAKISKILLAMEKGSLAAYQGKSLDEIEIEDELEPDLEEVQGETLMETMKMMETWNMMEMRKKTMKSQILHME
ncbi:hypothetical protein JOQ06_017848 [Pogonophryne albipinna]|uniref:Uncharacterized protein n=1 Tax=Pogonophryne albipinna TaxID=1090488 RepID=A0AAD6AI27_9TELE|nr:hypothetical protein JOQ06_017848 [Pogonophryne albipinna]